MRHHMWSFIGHYCGEWEASTGEKESRQGLASRQATDFSPQALQAPPPLKKCAELCTQLGRGAPPQKCAKIHKGDPYNFLHTLEEGPPPQKCAKLISKRGSGCEGGGPYSSCRTTGSCRHKALLSRLEGGFQSKKTLYRCRRL